MRQNELKLEYQKERIVPFNFQNEKKPNRKKVRRRKAIAAATAVYQDLPSKQTKYRAEEGKVAVINVEKTEELVAATTATMPHPTAKNKQSANDKKARRRKAKRAHAVEKRLLDEMMAMTAREADK